MPVPRYPEDLVQEFLKTLDQTERDLIDQLAEALGEAAEPFDKVCLLRFLRARSMNVDKAHKMFLEMLKMRAKYKADTIVEDWTPPEVLLKYFPHGFDSEDKEGGPVFLMGPGPCDVSGIMASASKNDIIKFSVYNTEVLARKVMQLTVEKKKLIQHVTVLVDVEGLGMSHFNTAFIGSFTGLCQAFELMWPETIRKVFVLYPPSLFPMAWKIVKPFLHENTRRKVNILTSDTDKNLATMSELIDPSALVSKYGGTLESDKIILGGTVPESYRNQKIEGTELWVPARSEAWVSIVAGFENCTLDYSVQTKDHNIALGLFWAPTPPVIDENAAISPEAEKDFEVVEKMRKHDCHVSPVREKVHLTKEGTYLMKFDNTFSWFKGKTVTYDVQVHAPENVTGKEASL